MISSDHFSVDSRRPIAYTKASGAGNDFIIVPGGGSEPTEERVRAWCRRALSVGADGVISLGRSQSDAGADARMVHRNADGGRADLCLNGSRCAARLAFELGWAQGEILRLRTDAGVLACRQQGRQRIELQLPDEMWNEPRRMTFELDHPDSPARLEGWLLTVGVPHLVVPWPDLGKLPIDTLGPLLRAHPALGAVGANVDFVNTVSEESLEIRTFERGVEGETLACGTGAVAAALAGASTGDLRWPVTVTTAGGFVLGLDRRPPTDREGEHPETETTVFLAGDARVVAWGYLSPEAETLPTPPAWSPASA